MMGQLYDFESGHKINAEDVAQDHLEIAKNACIELLKAKREVKGAEMAVALAMAGLKLGDQTEAHRRALDQFTQDKPETSNL